MQSAWSLFFTKQISFFNFSTFFAAAETEVANMQTVAVHCPVMS